MTWILEVVRFITDQHEKCGKLEHIGFMKARFRTRQNAASYYDRHNQHMRGLNAHDTWESDWDPVTKLKYIVRQERSSFTQTIEPFDFRVMGGFETRQKLAFVN